jgi:hypothetical protein
MITTNQRAEATRLAWLKDSKPFGGAFIEGIEITQQDLEHRPRHFDGKSDVNPSDSVYVTGELYTKVPGKPNLIYVADNESVVWEKDQDIKVSEMELRIYQELKKRGYNVPEASMENGKLKVKIAKGMSLTRYVKWYQMNKTEEGIGALEDLLKKALKKASEINTLTEQLTTEEERSSMRQKELDRLKKYGVEDIEGNYFGLKTMEALEIDDPEFLKLFSPLEKKLQQNQKKYGQWGFPINPEHIFVDKEGNLTYIDFNHFLYTSSQDLTSFFIDHHLPIVGQGTTNICQSPFYRKDREVSENENGKLIVLQSTANHERTQDYVGGYIFDRIFRVIKKVDHVFKKLEKAMASEPETVLTKPDGSIDYSGIVTHDQKYQTIQAAEYGLEIIRNSLNKAMNSGELTEEFCGKLYQTVFDSIVKKKKRILPFEKEKEMADFYWDMYLKP